MISDVYGQGFQSLDYGDAPDLRVMGEGLLAMVGQSVLRFSTASERNATLTAPQAGMTAFLASERLLTVYDGTEWTVVAAGTSTWQTVPLDTANWEHDALLGSWMYRPVNLFGEPTIMFRGGIRRKTAYPADPPTSIALNSTALPTGARPTAVRPMTVACSGGSSDTLALKIELGPDGIVTLFGIDSTNKPPWTSFNGVFCSL